MIVHLFACAADGDSGALAEGVQDLRAEFPEPPEGGVQFLTPDFEVPPHSETFWCYYGTWSEADVGVNYMAPYAVAPYSHHIQLKTTRLTDPPDGAFQNCPEGEYGMAAYSPLFESVGYASPGGEPFSVEGAENWIKLPEGWAMKLREGERWVVDAHFVNTTEDTLLLNAAVNLGVVATEEVETWAGVFQLDSGDLSLPPGDSTTTFDCAWEGEYGVLSAIGHAHDRATAYSVDWNGTRIYEVPEWSAAYRQYPKVSVWDPGELTVKVGDTFTTSCSYFNETEETLGFPDEMCTTMVVLYPAEDPRGCYGGVWD